MSRPTPGRVLRLLALLLLATAGCTPTFRAGPSAGETWAVRVENRTDRALVVSYEDSRGTGVLGTLRAGASTRFILDQVADREISIHGRSDVGDRTFGPVRVSLTPTGTPSVVLR